MQKSMAVPWLSQTAGWVCTSNPFYVLSAGLFLVGLRLSFGPQADDTWGLMSGLAGYTLLLAVTACLLVRFAHVWDDVRTVLLLVVLMFLATSVTFDEVLVFDPVRGFICYLAGLLFAVAVSEGVLHAIRLALPAWYRVPYYLVLALFFLYPLALSPLLAVPHSEPLLWGLFGFSSVAGLIFLTLLPAIRRGPDSVRGNGSPWPWPLYPWALFGLLAAAVPARAFLLCWSFDVLTFGDHNQLIFGGYFLVPFGLALAVLLLEGALVANRRGLLRLALAAPAGLVLLALVGHRSDPIYRDFLDTFTIRMGGDPLFLTLLALAGFYGYAALRRVSLAPEALTAALLALAFVGPDTLAEGQLRPPQPLPLLAAAALQLGLGIAWRRAGRCLLGGIGLAAAALVLPETSAGLRVLVAFHLVLIAVLAVGAAFDDALGRRLRVIGSALVLLACLAALFGRFDLPPGVPPWVVGAYPLGMAGVLAVYGGLLRHPPALVAAGLALVCWLMAGSWGFYRSLRQVVTGLDHIMLSLVLFVLAVLISLGKSGLLSRWLEASGWKSTLLDWLGFGAENRASTEVPGPPGWPAPPSTSVCIAPTVPDIQPASPREVTPE